MWASKHVLILLVSVALLLAGCVNCLRSQRLRQLSGSKPELKIGESSFYAHDAASDLEGLNDCADVVATAMADDASNRLQKRDFFDIAHLYDLNGDVADAVDPVAIPFTALADVDVAEMLLPPLLSLLPSANYNEFYEDLLLDANKQFVGRNEKRNGAASFIGCDCKVRNDLVDLGQQYFPRYLLSAVCQTQEEEELPQRCRRGSHCKALEYKVKVLTLRSQAREGSVGGSDKLEAGRAWTERRENIVRRLWRFKTVTVAAGCFCSY